MAGHKPFKELRDRIMNDPQRAQRLRKAEEALQSEIAELIGDEEKEPKQ